MKVARPGQGRLGARRLCSTSLVLRQFRDGDTAGQRVHRLVNPPDGERRAIDRRCGRH